MPESLRIFGLLLYKNFLVRKRQWILSFIGEILVPVGLMLCIWAIRDLTARPPQHVNATHGSIDSMKDKLEYMYHPNLYYSPNSSFINAFLNDLKNCYPKNTTAKGFATEEELLQQIKTDNRDTATAIIFDDKDMNDLTKNMGYKIRSKSLFEQELFVNPFMYYASPERYFVSLNWFLQTQYCVDTTFIKRKAAPGTYSISDAKFQKMPYPAYMEYDLQDMTFRTVFSSITIIAFLIPLMIETSRTASEKFLGVHILMSMNGVSNALNLFSWIFSGWLFLSIFCIIPIILLMTNSALNAIPYLSYGNPFIIWIVLNLNVLHLLAFGAHVSAHFTKSLLVMFGILILNIGSMVLQLYGINEENMYIVPYLGILFPNLLMYRTFEELNYYERIGEGNNWSNLFTVGESSYKAGGSIGMILILSIIGFFFHYVMSVYFYAIRPGKYGIKKSPFFFLKLKNKTNTASQMENLQYDEVNEQLFESVSRGVYTPGIQLRNLQKTYDIGFLNKAKVHALRGVSIDFYKGQITSLLGHNGAGKTTMMSILTGMISPTDGLVQVDSKDIKEKTSEVMNSMGLCTQENMVFPQLTVMQQLEFFAKLKSKGKSSSEIKQNVKLFLEKLKLYEKRNSLPQSLSGGQKRRLCLGLALVGDPSTLILDEPTSGLDPESRRVIWDMLLKMRGHKTILISTHDMEEADILGDRIAILHGGQLKSYGTSMFLKKIIGQGNVEVTLSTEPSCDPELIRQELNSEGTIMNEDGNKLVISIPNSPNLPDSLDSLERRKEQLGISGVSVSIISLEQVFLKVTQENDASVRTNHTFTTINQKVTGNLLLLQGIQGLLSKKMTYTLKNLSSLAIMLFNIILGLICISFILKASANVEQPIKTFNIKLDMYNQPEVMYKSYDKSFVEKYEAIAKSFNGKAIEAQGSNINEALLKYGETDRSKYDTHMIAAAEFNNTEEGLVVNALYSGTAFYSLPISVNMMMNTLLKIWAGDEYSISVSGQKLPAIEVGSTSNMFEEIVKAVSISIVFVLTFYSAIALFVMHPLRESSTGIKQLQRMSGASSLSYWGTMFVFDFVVCVLLIALIIISYLCIEASLNLQIFKGLEIQILLLQFLLFVINLLPLIYIFSFTKLSTSATVRLLTYIPLGLVIIELMMGIANMLVFVPQKMEFLRVIQKGIFLLIPYVSFLHGQVSFYVTALRNARCKKLPNLFYDTRCKSGVSSDECCKFDCYDGSCKKLLNYFTDFEEDITLEESLVYMVITPILYFGILTILEKQLVQKMLNKMMKHEALESSTDEQVKKEKSLVAQRISVIKGYNVETMIDKTITCKTENGISSNHKEDNSVFLVYELRKKYGKLLAVKDISFKINQRECFGLLGINGAGKSTTFRMMTGGEIPDHGMMYINDKDITEDREYFLSQMGYCPQNDAIIKSLNAYDHLRLFAGLRGVAKNEIEEEVQIWIERLNLIACASQPSGTYSGGNKRRLNIAIALIGNPNLVLMDEPTTGVDPGARRSLWNVIQSCQKLGQAVILTSHSMEECEALCNKLAIMVGGKFVCLGPSQELKQRFGAGYDIQIKMNPELANEQISDIKSEIKLRLNCEVVDENLGYLMYHVKPNNVTWRNMYDVMNEIKNRFNCIDDYSVLSSTLEQLFLLFARAANDNPTVST